MTLPDDQRIILQVLAREIMSWPAEPNKHGVKYGPLRLYNDNTPYITKHEGWNPLENIADAWMLVEQLRLTVTPHGTKWGCAHCNWSQFGETTAVGMTNGRDWYLADTAPRAISLAAYAAFIERRL